MKRLAQVVGVRAGVRTVPAQRRCEMGAAEPVKTGDDEREEVLEYLRNMEISAQESVVAVVKALDSAVEPVKLTDEQGAVLLEEQLRRVRAAETDEDARKELQKARQAMKVLTKSHAPGPRCYTAAITACALAGETALADQYLQLAEENAVALGADACNALLDLPKYSSRGLNFLDFMRKRGVEPTEETYNRLLLAARDAGDGVLVLRIFRKLKEENKATAEHYQWTMQALATYFSQQNDFERLFSTVRTMLSASLPFRTDEDVPQVLAAFLRYIKSTDDADSARATAELATLFWEAAVRKPSSGKALVVPPQSAFHSILRIYALTGNPGGAEDVIVDLQERNIDVTEVMRERVTEAYSSRASSA
ncbi:hypothetical protein DIPPA_12091 [Diplonema papillatum]|nr:hypothetical protein DIPPA_12091 [Diplonema papillatum]|eukprot:gene6064-9320_t